MEHELQFQNHAAFPNSIKSRKVKVKKHLYAFYRHWGMVGVWVGGILCKRDQEQHVFLYISDKNGTSKLNKLAIFDQKWNFWNLVANFDK